jgi:hypothetical protein
MSGCAAGIQTAIESGPGSVLICKLPQVLWHRALLAQSGCNARFCLYMASSDLAIISSIDSLAEG